MLKAWWREGLAGRPHNHTRRDDLCSPETQDAHSRSNGRTAARSSPGAGAALCARAGAHAGAVIILFQ
jgi:hypothetical protein